VAQSDAPTKAVLDTEVLQGTFEAEEDPHAELVYLWISSPESRHRRPLKDILIVLKNFANQAECLLYSSMAECITHYSGAASNILRLIGADHGDTIEYLLALTMMTNA
jgi:hypothetical protein